MLLTFLTAFSVAIACAIAVRFVPWVSQRLPIPATAMLMTFAALGGALAVSGMTQGVWSAVLAALGTVVVGAIAIAGSARLMDVVQPYRPANNPDVPTIRERVVKRADAVTWRIGRWNVVAVFVRSVFRAGDVRVTGLAAEMSYYALISLVPIATALGASLGFLQTLIGPARITEIQEWIVNVLTTVFAQQVASDILAPFVEGLLSQGSGSIAIGAVVITLYLASRAFRAAVRALEDAYRVETRRNIVVQYLLGLAFTLGALATLLTVVLLLVVGPFFFEAIAEALALSAAFETTWAILRWPVALLVLLLFLTLLYRYAPKVKTVWRHCLPGAVIGLLGVLLVSTIFLQYVQYFTPAALASAGDETLVVQAATQMLSLVLVAVLWLWLMSIVVLLGGIVNAEIHEERLALDAEA